MLYGYPLAATTGNWLHECVLGTIENVHAHVEAHGRVPGWPNVLPEPWRSTLATRLGLRDGVKRYGKVLLQLNPSERSQILVAMRSQNRISELLSGACDCELLDELPEPIRAEVKLLFGYAYDTLLDELGIRDEHYKLIYKEIPAKVCPFCGTTRFKSPEGPREAYDHYLVWKLYPFAAVNLRNLVPMCHDCNSHYKKTVDLLRACGVRRTALDPYNWAAVRVSLDKSAPLEGKRGVFPVPAWEIEFEPLSNEVSTWETVFCIKKRYIQDHLDADFDSWLRTFQTWARREGVLADTDDAIVRALQRYENIVSFEPLHDRGFLKAAVFRMLRLRCEEPVQELLTHFRNLLRTPAPG